MFSNKRGIDCWDWNKNSDINPRKLKAYSHTNAWFICDVCNHSFQSMISRITLGKWCLYCANQKLCENEDCTICFEKSFASHPKSSQWSK